MAILGLFPRNMLSLGYIWAMIDFDVLCTLWVLFFTYFVSANQLPGFSSNGKLGTNGLRKLVLHLNATIWVRLILYICHLNLKLKHQNLTTIIIIIIICRYASIVTIINKTMYHKTWVKWKQSCLNLTYQSLQAFGGHRVHYQVHINTNGKLFAGID